ncbi:hypothetical protein [Planctellipticum variicoloris]|uniref:hypothetical protein n=1 Tax=Planctellipticum variicoloris TaxID=3064265 RepID=UPI003013C6BC|nr:hypothetical protein SH412_003687 [Planctomycetaceae bacterium SH412]
MQVAVPPQPGLSLKLVFPKPAFGTDVAGKASFRLLEKATATAPAVAAPPPRQSVRTFVEESATDVSVEVSAAGGAQGRETLLEMTITNPGVELRETFLKVTPPDMAPEPVLGDRDADVWAAVTITNQTGVTWPEGMSLQVQLDADTKIDTTVPAGGLKTGGRLTLSGKTNQTLALTFGVRLTDLVIPPNGDPPADVSKTKLNLSVGVKEAASARKALAFLQTKPPSRIDTGAGMDWSELLPLSSKQSALLVAGTTVVNGPLGGETRVSGAKMSAQYDLAGISAGYLFYRPSWTYSMQVSSKTLIECKALEAALRASTPIGWAISSSTITAIEGIPSGADLKTNFKLTATFKPEGLVSRSLLLTDVDGLSQLGSRGDLLAVNEKSLKKSLDSFESLQKFLEAALKIQPQPPSKVQGELQSIATEIGNWRTQLTDLLAEIKSTANIPDAIAKLQEQAQTAADDFNAFNDRVLAIRILPTELVQNQSPSPADGKPCPTPAAP